MRTPRLVRWATVAAATEIAIVSVAAGARAGGIWLDSNGPQSISVNGLHCDIDTNIFRTTEWRYQPRISAGETYDLFQANHTIGANAEIIEDITPSGNATASGLPRSSKVTRRMIVADILLGDIMKGFGYITPLYRLANGYVPLPCVTRRF